MALKRKTKLISFRMSEDEFRDYHYLCAREGFSSFSDLVRVAVQQLVANRLGRGDQALQQAMDKIFTRMDELDRDVKQLMAAPR